MIPHRWQAAGIVTPKGSVSMHPQSNSVSDSCQPGDTRKRHPLVECTCLHCGKVFRLSRSEIARGRGKYCSPECYRARESELRDAGLLAKRRGVYHTVTCACGCGTSYEINNSRYQMATGGNFFLNHEHRLRWYGAIRNANWLRSGTYGAGWKAIADAIRKRDKVCRHCGKTPEQNGRKLDVHHIKAYRVSLDHSPENLIALCRSCHYRITATEKIPPTLKPVTIYDKTCPECGKGFQTETFLRVVCGDACRRVRSNRIGAAAEKKRMASDPDARRKRLDQQEEWRRQSGYAERANELRRERRRIKRLQATTPSPE
jgi:5-methylcytosine-specific restriction protein A